MATLHTQLNSFDCRGSRAELNNRKNKLAEHSEKLIFCQGNFRLLVYPSATQPNVHLAVC